MRALEIERAKVSVREGRVSQAQCRVGVDRVLRTRASADPKHARDAG